MHRFLTEPALAGYAARFGTGVVKTAVDGVLSAVRVSAAQDASVPPDFELLVARVLGHLAGIENDGLIAVLNATGILLHTNLGRAPLAAEALEAVAAIASGYSNLEFDLEAGTRGSRHARVTTLVRAVSGAADALVVNNCAGAVLLILDTFAKGREVVVSRNQLIEIGGGFRLPEVLARSGATLVEVGTTNKVYLHDFERALTARTALLLRSHSSNFRIEGFTADVEPAELAKLGRRAGVPTVEDLGSGALVDLAAYGLPHERTVPEALADGIELVAFSGDKLLGGPQAGIIAGSTSAIARLRANPLLRALRVDKATLAALGATLRLYLEPGGIAKIPLYAMLGASAESLQQRAKALVAALARSDSQGALETAAVATHAYLGGGSAPAETLPSFALALRDTQRGASALAARLRAGRPPVVARVEDGQVLVDLRAIPPERDGELLRALAAAAG